MLDNKLGKRDLPSRQTNRFMEVVVVGSLDVYRLLGRSGLRVSPLSLGTMTFGTDWGWGADTDEARRIFDTYVDRGGNFIDTANQYTNGTAEKLLGKFAHDKRESLVLATKYTLAERPEDPNSGGNHRKSMLRTVEASLRRLDTDYIDLLYLHAWDNTTPVEEILRGMDDLVRAGKVLYVGISDTPAWQISRMQAIADLRGWAPLVALQIEYSLIERTVERDLIPMAGEMGLGVIPWSPLAGGVLTGKYIRDDLDHDSDSASAVGTRKNVAAANGALTERGLAIAEVVKKVAAEIGTTPSRVALAWTMLNPTVTAPIVGARTLAQLEDNLGALEVQLAQDQLSSLETASAIELGFPHDFLNRPMTRNVMHGDAKIETASSQQ
ncbi:MAG TPA: aldo/keto reductase [Mycobacteriales bacterium]|jgi:aryl-alcohol dehydrogenase-like predicted oxidoreductase|nr:aldo/keto reductase [Mycobacteriales bacterium]